MLVTPAAEQPSRRAQAWLTFSVRQNMTSIYRTSVSPNGFLQCIVEGESSAVWSYLFDLSAKQVISDVPLCSLTPLESARRFKEESVPGDTPPLVKEFATERAVIADLSEERLSIGWPKDGRSVVIAIDGEPFAMMLSAERHGYSKATQKNGPWGKPWDDELFRKTEANQALVPTPMSVTSPAEQARVPDTGAAHL